VTPYVGVSSTELYCVTCRLVVLLNLYLHLYLFVYFLSTPRSRRTLVVWSVILQGNGRWQTLLKLHFSLPRVLPRLASRCDNGQVVVIWRDFLTITVNVAFSDVYRNYDLSTTSRRYIVVDIVRAVFPKPVLTETR